MLTFKSAADLRQLPSNHPAYPIIADLVQRLIVDWPMPLYGRNRPSYLRLP